VNEWMNDWEREKGRKILQILRGHKTVATVKFFTFSGRLHRV
jgi:hypothetical protein